MPIEFACSQCGKQLRTPDETAGRQAKCPQCGAIMQIPNAAAAPPAAEPPPSPFGGPASGGAEGWNPYASPSVGGHSATATHAAAAGDIVPTRVEFGKVFDATWRIFRNQMGFGALVALALLGVYIVIFIPIGIVMFAMQGPQIAPGPNGPQFVAPDPNPVADLIVNVISWLAGTWVYMGVLRCFLKVARGQSASVGDIFTGTPYYTRGLVVNGIFTAVGILGTLPALLTNNPGVAILGTIVFTIINIVLYFLFAQALPLIVDRDLSVGDALSMSTEVMKGNKLMLFLVFLVFGIVGGLFCLITCGLGLFLYVPYMFLLTAVFYLQATGQPTADVAPAMPR